MPLIIVRNIEILLQIQGLAGIMKVLSISNNEQHCPAVFLYELSYLVHKFNMQKSLLVRQNVPFSKFHELSCTLAHEHFNLQVATRRVVFHGLKRIAELLCMMSMIIHTCMYLQHNGSHLHRTHTHTWHSIHAIRRG